MRSDSYRRRFIGGRLTGFFDYGPDVQIAMGDLIAHLPRGWPDPIGKDKRLVHHHQTFVRVADLEPLLTTEKISNETKKALRALLEKIRKEEGITHEPQHQ